MAGAPPLQRPGPQDLKDLLEIKARPARTQTAIGTVIATKTATGTKTSMQAHRHRARKDNIPSKIPTEDGPALETENAFGLDPDADTIATR